MKETGFRKIQKCPVLESSAKIIQSTVLSTVLSLVMVLSLSVMLSLIVLPLPVQAADTYTVYVEVPGQDTVTLEMQKSDYIGNVKFKLQKQMDVDLNKMDLIYKGKVLSEVKRFNSGIVPTGSTITMVPSSRWNYDEVKGIDDITFSIARPKEESLTKIYAKDYGMSPANSDNTAAFTKALSYCTSNAYLVVEQGTYHFRGMTDDIAFNNMENVIIDGNGSTFIFDNKYCMKIYGGNGVEFRNLKVNWDWDKIPVGSLVQIDKKVSDTVFDIRFIGVDDVDENIPIGTFWYLDPDDLVIGSYGKYKAFTPGAVGGAYLKKVEKIDNNVLRITHSTNEMKHFNEGEYYLLRHFEYSGRVFGTTSYAKNITFDNVSIYGFTGMGWVFSSKANHFQIINSYLGLEPDGPKERRISTAADAIHILNTGGYFRISNNDLSFTGDDIINIHDDVMDIMSIDESRTTIRCWATAGFEGKVSFRNSQLGKFTDYEATIVSFETDTTKVDKKGNKYERIVTFAEPLPAEITSDCYICHAETSSSNYVISNNYIHEARARAALLNDDYGLFENNYVYHLISGAIQMKAGISPGRYMEGEGASHVVARNNIFEACNFGTGAPIVDIGVEIGVETSAGIIKEYSTEIIQSDIRIENNVFLNCCYGGDHGKSAIAANNVDNLVISGNVLEEGGGILVQDTVGARTVLNNNIHTEHTYVNGACTVCNKLWETEIDGITYRVKANVVKRRPIAETIPDGTKGELAISVVKAGDVEGKDIVLEGEITDEVTGQKFILTTIEKDVFADSNAASITIPESVTTLGENALGDIENITYLGDTPPKQDADDSGASDDPNTPEKTPTNNGELQSSEKIDLSKCEIGYEKKLIYYTGKAIKPKLFIRMGNKTLVNGVDYKLTYKNNIKVGQATATITGIGKYTGKAVHKFSISPAKIKIKKLKASKNKIKVTWSPKKKMGASYKIQYSTNRSFKKAKTIKVKSAKTSSVVIKKLKPGKTYYVRIVATKKVGKKTYSGAYSKVKKIKTKKK